MSQRFLGMPYPITKDAQGYFHSQSGLRQIKSDLLILLLTNPGERVMLPEFGTGLRELVFEPNDSTLRARARELIVSAIETWEPRVTVDQIEITTDIDEDRLNPQDDGSEGGAILLISIMFKDPENMQTVEELRLEVPLGGNQ